MNINRNKFFSNVLTMLSGSAVALAVPLLASPMLSRLYSPESFGQLGIFTAVISIGAVVATGRYELAVLIPKNNHTALAVATFAIMMAGFVSFVIFIVLGLIFFFTPQIMSQTLPPWIWLIFVPIGVLLISTIQTLTYWHSRKAGFREIAGARAWQAIGMTGSQTATGVLAGGGLGLMIGYIFGLLVSVLGLTHTIWKDLRSGIEKMSRRTVFRGAKRFASMPKFLIPGHLANILSSQLPVIMLTALYGPVEAGLFAFAERMVLIPCAVIANSIGEVYRQASAAAFQTQGNCLKIFLRTKLQLVILGAVFAVVIMLGFPTLFPIIFGEAWHEATRLSISLSLIAFFQTVSSPLSQTVYLASKHKIDLVWQVLRLLLSVLAIFTGSIFYDDYSSTVLLHALAFSFAYTVHSGLQWRAARGG